MALELPNITWYTPAAGYPEGSPGPSVGDMENYRIGRSVGLVAIHDAVLSIPGAPATLEMIGPGGVMPIEQTLEETIAALEAQGRPVAGLAAQQVGVGLNVVRANVGQGLWVNLRNPKIVDQSDELLLDTEGCHSCGPMGGFVFRPKWLEVVSDDEHGEPGRPVRYKEFAARVLAHEIDHPQGKRVPDRIIEQGREIFWVPAETLRVKVGEYSVYRTFYSMFGRWPFVVSPDLWGQYQRGAVQMEDFTPPPSTTN